MHGGWVEPGNFDWNGTGGDERLRQLWGDGMSATQIAALISREFNFHVSKNAVIGRARRLELSKRKTQSVSSSDNLLVRKPRQKRATYAKKRKIEITKPPELDRVIPRADIWKSISGASILALIDTTPTTCHWPVSQDGVWDSPADGFCGLPADEGCPYCKEHRAIAYNPNALRSADKSYGHWK